MRRMLVGKVKFLRVFFIQWSGILCRHIAYSLLTFAFRVAVYVYGRSKRSVVNWEVGLRRKRGKKRTRERKRKRERKSRSSPYSRATSARLSQVRPRRSTRQQSPVPWEPFQPINHLLPATGARGLDADTRRGGYVGSTETPDTNQPTHARTTIACLFLWLFLFVYRIFHLSRVKGRRKRAWRICPYLLRFLFGKRYSNVHWSFDRACFI